MSTYTVISGDTMWGIAKKYGIELNELLTANPQIINPAFILPGQTINIPGPTTEPGTPTAPSVPSDIGVLEAKVIRLVNIERKKTGRPALTPNNELNSVARIKSEDFIKNNYFSHNSPT
jgi:spore coat assembly protein SafA